MWGINLTSVLVMVGLALLARFIKAITGKLRGDD